MNLDEYLLFIPLLIYGTALAELMVQWKLSFNLKNMHWVYFLTVLALTELAIGNIYNYLQFYSRDTEHHYLSYLSYLSPPLLLHFVTISFPPTSMTQEQAYASFNDRISLIFSVVGIYIAAHLLPVFSTAIVYMTIIKILGVLICLLIIFTKKMWAVYLFFALWVVSFIAKIVAY